MIIPCVAKHFPYIFTLLQHFQEQTSPPEEIVISVSEIGQISEDELLRVEEYPWKFEVKFLKHSGKKSAGQNRNLACEIATGDLIICQDADDIPHPQRVEIVKYIFENYYVDHLLHGIFMEDRQRLPCVEYDEHLARGSFREFASSLFIVLNGFLCRDSIPTGMRSMILSYRLQAAIQRLRKKLLGKSVGTRTSVLEKMNDSMRKSILWLKIKA